jgi:hypothetical protein
MALSRQGEEPVSIRDLVRQPAAYLPVAMSTGALATVVWFVAAHGLVRQPDEGAQVHLWQFLVAGQVPLIAHVAFAWIPRGRRQAILVLAIQVTSVTLLAVGPLLVLGGL